MAIICNSVIPANLFSFDSVDQKVVSELSTLKSSSGFSRIYSDACNIACGVGFWILNQKTGNMTLWVLTNEIRNSENGLMYLELKPVQDNSLKHQDRVSGWTMIIIND